MGKYGLFEVRIGWFNLYNHTIIDIYIIFIKANTQQLNSLFQILNFSESVQNCIDFFSKQIKNYKRCRVIKVQSMKFSHFSGFYNFDIRHLLRF